MPRSTRKGVFIDQSLLRKIKKSSADNHRRPVQTNSRRSTIIAAMVGMNIQVHTGNKYEEVHIVPEMVGKKLGAFAPTRKQAKHKSDDKRK
ncbi:30S ribosomal protein S19 [Candidatus Comchoanobacter bicostacola]|uniref:Small ribosomal subunit protein uS19 n=1 Tax=Candidatus Comchoanobacter bicostacola TaxID=2919598 RepID=A0ABY5DK84_9GAMM|nr:30S ribosomal protein S19 [Candidatus Comchoanobacter bicostacola]UTC24294.1 30S ribosomal protein S19 [Candidatus Comchoanobacter bicostacola]